MGAIHTREAVLSAFEMRDSGMSPNRIRETLRLGSGTVERWLSDPKMNPYLDDIAIERAIGGDMSVFDALTHFEREEVLSQLAEKSDYIDFELRFGKHAHRVTEAIRKMHRRGTARTRRASRPRPRPQGITKKQRSPEFDAKVRELRSDGATMDYIAGELGTSKSTVARVLADAA